MREKLGISAIKNGDPPRLVLRVQISDSVIDHLD